MMITSKSKILPNGNLLRVDMVGPDQGKNGFRRETELRPIPGDGYGPGTDYLIVSVVQTPLYAEPVPDAVVGS